MTHPYGVVDDVQPMQGMSHKRKRTCLGRSFPYHPMISLTRSLTASWVRFSELP